MTSATVDNVVLCMFQVCGTDNSDDAKGIVLAGGGRWANGMIILVYLYYQYTITTVLFIKIYYLSLLKYHFQTISERCRLSDQYIMEQLKKYFLIKTYQYGFHLVKVECYFSYQNAAISDQQI